MTSYSITLYRSEERPSAIDQFEDALRYSALRYSLSDVGLSAGVNQKALQEALHKGLEVCRLAGVDSSEHFKPIYVFDNDSATTFTDWLMSKKGLGLMVMPLPLNQQTARWLLEL